VRVPILAPLMVLCSVSAAPALAEDGRRFVTVFQEQVDGKPQPASVTETTLVSKLVARGVGFVDEAQSRQIRAIAAAESLIAGTVPEGITSFDADVIVACVATLAEVPSDILPKGTFRYDAQLLVRVIGVDDGRVLAAFSEHGKALGHGRTQAAARAAEAALAALLDPIAAFSKVSDRRIELHVAGLSDFGATERLTRALQSLPEVSAAQVRHAARSLTKFELTTRGAKPRDIAGALHARAGDLGLVVFGYSSSVVRADFSPVKTSRLSLTTARFEPEGRGARNAWRGEALAGMVTTALSNVDLFAIHAEERPLEVRPRAKLAQLVQARGHDPRGSVVLTGRYRDREGGVSVNAQLIAAASGAVVAGAERTCTDVELAACVAGLGAELATRLGERITRQPGLFPGSGPGASGADKTLRLRTIEVTDIFPARMAAGGRSLGKVVLENTGKEAVTDVELGFELPELATGPGQATLARIEPGARVELPIELGLDHARLLAQNGNTPTTLAVTLEYEHDGFRRGERRTAPVMIYARNTLSWKDMRSVASFVTPRAPAVLGLAQSWHRQLVDADRGRRLAVPIAVFEALGASGLRYRPDPASPFGAEDLDFVQYPAETLGSGGGDCDDLAVAFAAFNEALGVRVLLVGTPGHLFTAVPTGRPPQGAHLVSGDPGRFLVHEGQLWIPIETTKIQGGFLAAWDAGAAELARWKKDPSRIEIVDVRAAWRDYPAADLGVVASVPAEAKELGSRVRTTLESIDARRVAELEKAIESVDGRLAKRADAPELLNERARLLAQLGREPEARVVLEGLVGRDAGGPEALNNLGNLDLAAGKPEQALVHYAAALKLAEALPKQVAVHVNAALAALVLGQEERFTEHIVACLAAGADDAVLALTRASDAIGARQKGSEAEVGVGVRDLAVRIERAYAAAGKTPPSAAAVGAGGAKADESATRPVHDLVHWLVP
jgi:TolB-like protein